VYKGLVLTSKKTHTIQVLVMLIRLMTFMKIVVNAK
jgi:hypothetical protein